MKPVFNETGLATTPGNIKVFYYSQSTGEYTGESDEYINIGVSLPANATDLPPGGHTTGYVSVFKDGGWQSLEDHRGETVYAIANAEKTTVDYIGNIKPGFTTAPPKTPYDKWDGAAWVTDIEAKHQAEIAEAEAKKSALLSEADAVTADWRTELALGIISDQDRAKLIEWMAYIKAIKAVDTGMAPNVLFPKKPE